MMIKRLFRSHFVITRLRTWPNHVKHVIPVAQNKLCVCEHLETFGARHYSKSVDLSIPQPLEEEEVTNVTSSNVPKRSVKYVLNNCSPDEHVRIQGWVRAYRRLKSNCFLEVSDGSSEHRLAVATHVERIPKDVNLMHCSVDITGILKRNPKDPSVLELHPTAHVTLVGPCDQKEYPFGGKIRYTMDHIRQYIHLRPKTNKFSSLFRLRSEMSRAVSDYFTNNGFFQVHVPILTSNDCEGAGEIFTVRPGSDDLIKSMRKPSDKEGTSNARPLEEVFFDKRVHLSVSGQLHLESATCGLEKVWTFSPVFRAENSQSTRHLAEFYMIEAELAFAYEIEQILEVMEGLVKFCVKKILSDCIGDWSLQTKDGNTEIRKILDHLVTHPFTIMTFDEASKLLKDKASSIVEPGKGLSREQELILVERLNDNRPTFVIDWPKDIKPFYMRGCTYDSNKVSAVDLLVPTVGELCGGSLREPNPSKLESKISEMDPSGKLRDSLAWYVDLRKYGGTPTGGFGLGFDRLMQLVTGIENIKDVSPFPRWPHHCPM